MLITAANPLSTHFTSADGLSSPGGVTPLWLHVLLSVRLRWGRTEMGVRSPKSPPQSLFRHSGPTQWRSQQRQGPEACAFPVCRNEAARDTHVSQGHHRESDPGLNALLKRVAATYCQPVTSHSSNTPAPSAYIPPAACSTTWCPPHIHVRDHTLHDILSYSTQSLQHL